MPIRWSVVLCFVVGLGAAEYHVSPAGGAGNPGTATLPFATIAQASAVMVAGDTCTIHAGVYRETLRPARSGSAGLPITYRAAGDGQALLSAGVEVTGWTTHSGSIWRAAMPIADRGRWNNQVFVDGIAMVEARWPNVPWTEGVGFDLLSAPLAGCTHALGSDVIRLDGPMPYGADFWNGTKVWAEIGARWCVQTATVTASTATTLTVTGKSDAWYPDAGTTWAGEAGALYLSGKLGALDAPGEWFMDGGTLYLRTERSDDPRTRRVEVRSGRLVADLSGRDHIVLLGLHGYAGSAKLSGGNCVLRGCSFRYVTQEHPSTWSTSCGLDIGGQDNLVEDCVIDGSTSHGVNLSGARNTVRNTRISNVGSMGDYSSGVFLRGTRHTVERSAITRCGRFGIYFGDLLTPTAGGQHTIRHNDIGYTNLLTQDGGAIYSWMVHGAGTEIAYNLVHDTVFWSNPAHRTSEVNGIYLDDGSKDFKVHHNVVWGVDDGIRMNNWASTNLPVEQYTVRGNHISNNTLFANAKFDMRGLNASSDRAAPFSDIVVRNNLAARSGFVGTTLSNNLVVTASSFVDAANRDFRLVSGSPAVDAGLVISGITDGYQGAAPDIGAYERGAMAWTAGVDVSRLPAPPRFVVQPASLTVTAGRNATFTVVAAGTPAPTYRWQRDGVDIGGATAATLTIAPAAVGAAYTCIIANASGVAVSEAAILTVRPATGTGTSSTGPGPSGGACGAGMAGLTMLGGILLASFRCMTR